MSHVENMTAPRAAMFSCFAAMKQKIEVFGSRRFVWIAKKSISCEQIPKRALRNRTLSVSPLQDACCTLCIRRSKLQEKQRRMAASHGALRAAAHDGDPTALFVYDPAIASLGKAESHSQAKPGVTMWHDYFGTADARFASALRISEDSAAALDGASERPPII